VTVGIIEALLQFEWVVLKGGLLSFRLVGAAEGMIRQGVLGRFGERALGEVAM
jgi:hypothetical protein